jgi:hypothetical protein
MSEQTRSLILQHWDLANARRWGEFGQLLHPELLYEVPQTREYIESGPGYLEMFSTWPGDWTAKIKHLVCEQSKAICIIDFVVDAEIMTGISVFELNGQLIWRVTDFWPEPYDPPPRSTSLMKRRPE